MNRKLIALFLLVSLCLGLCSVASAEDKYTIKVLTIWSDTDDGDVGPTIVRILDEFCATHEGFDYEYEYCQQFETAAKLAVLVASNDVPDLFVYEPGSAMNELIDNDVMVNLSEHFQDLGLDLEEVYSPAAIGALHSVSEYDDIYYVCNGLSGEAVWYNKPMFEEYGLEVPQTWDELEALCDKLLELGIQPFALPNDAQWPMTRWIMMYAARLAGYDVHLRASVNDGIRFDDDVFIQAATKIQEMCQKGYFGQGFNALTQDDGYAMFLNGKCAMLYQGTWGIANFRAANVEAGELSAEEIGHFNPGYIEGSPISPEEVAATVAICPNMGICVGKERFDQGTNHEFLKYFFTHYGDYCIEDGFTCPYNDDFLTVHYDENDLFMQYYTEIINSAKYSTLWNEAMMTTEISNICLENAQLLGEGAMSPEQFCSELAAAVDARFS